jgi:hypothetical protein
MPHKETDMTERLPLNESTLRFQFARLTQEEASHRRHAENCRQLLADLRARAEAHGLARAFRELENPPAIVPRVEEALVRVRVVEGFSQEWKGLPYDAPMGSVIDLPRSFVKGAPHLFERVAANTQLFRPEPAWPRDAAPAPSPFGGLRHLLG